MGTGGEKSKGRSAKRLLAIPAIAALVAAMGAAPASARHSDCQSGVFAKVDAERVKESSVRNDALRWGCDGPFVDGRIVSRHGTLVIVGYDSQRGPSARTANVLRIAESQLPELRLRPGPPDPK